MPLALPNLDTRRWADLVDEGRATIARGARVWNDLNLHDPGVTLLELTAYFVDRELYRVNRIPEAHRRKFLRLLGYRLRPPIASRCVLALSPAAGALDVPRRLAFRAGALLFTTDDPSHAVPLRIAAMQAFDGRTFTDVTRIWAARRPLHPFGVRPWLDSLEPDAAPALYIGFATEPDFAARVAGGPVSLWFFADPALGTDLRLIEREIREAIAECEPGPRGWPCEGAVAVRASAARGVCDCSHGEGQPSLFRHHSLRLEWDANRGGGFERADVVFDGTRSFTLDGRVSLRLVDVEPRVIGCLGEAFHYVRVRIAAGQPDAVPLLQGCLLNPVVVRQRMPVDRRIDVEGVPDETVELEDDQVSRGRFDLLRSSDHRDWRVVPDYDMATPASRVCVLTHGPAATLTFGDGDRGRLLPPGDLQVSYRATSGAGGNVSADKAWAIIAAPEDREDDPLTRYNAGVVGDVTALLTLDAAIASIRNPFCGTGGADAEDVDAAAGRAASSLWAHERLVELADGRDTLDGIAREAILEREAPARGTTLLDLERLALSVPAGYVARARAWADVDPLMPCVREAGAVLLVVVPAFPPERPVPSAPLLALLRRYMARRRVLGTRLRIIGPQYVVVTVRTRIRARDGADRAEVATATRRSLDEFLHPLRGGQDGTGWPFGRDVYRSEVLALLDGVPGVDHVDQLELARENSEPQCANLCIPPFHLICSGAHHVEVV